jgi:hypothetical protein
MIAALSISAFGRCTELKIDNRPYPHDARRYENYIQDL